MTRKFLGSLGYIVLSMAFSGGIGIVFGIYPAFTASKLDPIEALREEGYRGGLEVVLWTG